MIVVKDLSMSFAGKVLFDDANFSINTSERVGLIGRNGSGKSTFLKLILGQIDPDEGFVNVPDYYVIGYMEQHLKFTQASVLLEVCSVLSAERAHEGWKGERILRGLDFTDEHINLDPRELSGGYQIKISLAKILLLEPDILLLDEPTNYLDIRSIRWLGQFLRQWKNELILITHDRGFMDSVITHTLIIHRNKFRKCAGKTATCLHQIETEEENYIKSYEAEAAQRAKTEQWIRKFGAKASKASIVQSRVKMLAKQENKIKLSKLQNLNFKFNYAPFESKESMMIARNLTFGYNSESLLVKGLNFAINENDAICIVGRNGNGKSTLLQLLAGILLPMSGTINMHSKVQCGYFGQTNVQQLNQEWTIYKELEAVNPAMDQTRIRHVCSMMLFPGEFAFKKISVLSGGEKGRVMLGKILLRQTNMLLLDEPTNHFDIESAEVLLAAIKEFPGAVVMVTHDEYFLREVATKLIVFDAGRVQFYDGGYDKFLKNVGWSSD